MEAVTKKEASSLEKTSQSKHIGFLKKQFRMNKYLYLMLLPVVLYYLVFQYLPMLGIVIAFKDYSFKYNLFQNIFSTPFVGFKHFISFFTGISFKQVVLNTLIINIYGLLFSFPAPIILALLLNELRFRRFKGLVQSITYMPHFISMVVMTGIVIDFVSSNGLINNIIQMTGHKKIMFLIEPSWFRTIYISSDIWQQVGWGSIIYLAALAGINPELYESAVMDGASRWRQMISITIPCLLPTIMILLILRIGQMMSIGVEKIILLYQPMTYDTSDVISSYVFRQGILNQQISYTTAVGFFNSVINFTLLSLANFASKRATESSLW